MKPATPDFKDLSVEETIRLLETSVNGLTSAQVNERLARYGFNEVVEKGRSPAVDFLSRYWGPMPWLLEFTMLISYISAHYLELLVIFSLLTINALIGSWHSRGSQKALELLKQRLAVKAKVLRDGSWVTIPARELVPGDVIAIGLGDLVPADAKIISETEILVDQSALTGESLPVERRKSDIVYSSSIVKRGEAKCVVVSTGKNTYFGKTAELVRIARPKSHQQQIMMAVVRYSLYVSMAALILVLAYAFLLHMDAMTMLTFALVFLMGAIPVALPAVFAVVLATGAIELSKKNVLVTKLSAIEDAASMQVLCLDKTGTITQNKLSVVESIPFSGFEKEDVVLMASLASSVETGDPMDLAIIERARSTGVGVSDYVPVSFTPFDPTTKRSEAIVEHGGQRFKVVKGAPRVVAALCQMTEAEFNERIDRIVIDQSSKGYRTLAVARSKGSNLNDLQLVGLLALADPPRPDSKEIVEELKELGIAVKMLTGDNVTIAKEIARQVSLGDRIVRMPDLKGRNEEEQLRIVEENDGFAEIYPEDKYLIVKLLQSKGYIVGMTGDGVNDAPALKQAEIGIAVSNSTDVAKASASIVLTEPGMRGIIDAVKTSRQIYQRMLTWVLNKVSKVIQFVGLLVLGFFWLRDLLLAPIGMVLLIFANDFVTMSLATDNSKSTTRPNLWNVKNITLAALVVGLLLVVEGAVVIFVGIHYFHMPLATLQTFAMLALVFSSLFRVFIVRERGRFWNSRPGRALLLSSVGAIVGFAFLGVCGLVVPPVTALQVAFVLAFSSLFTLAIDFPKYWVFRKLGL
ncbi:MAG: magnesium-transporting ATPase [Candidatus Hadarchaeum yellowstonense]|uniref:Magnesium-transporting ATPase n=1 Tax=Hadarchaeum yellowstonense TaxID=1776334 RepID=A0A147JTY4_HADYE|nr:MAG: magnesium-transporting ATPase [Candidatus Hadarchaeum yellowstonense]